jgi:hypothetical protein
LLSDYEYACENSGGYYLVSTKKCECDIGQSFIEGQGCTASAVVSAPNISSVAKDCEGAGGWYSFTHHSCMCGDLPMSYEIQRCEKGEIKSKNKK